MRFLTVGISRWIILVLGEVLCVKEQLAWVLMPTYQMSGVSLSCGNQLYLQHSVSKE